MSRKIAVQSFFILCVLVIAAAPAFAQGVAFQSSSLPQQVRIEGLTETVGAVVLQATGSGTIPTTSSITLVYSGTITGSALTAAVVSGAFNGTSCGAGTCTSHNGTASFAVAATGNQLTVSVPSTGTAATFSTGDYIVISQVRMNINTLGASATTITATLSGTSAAPTTNPITFTQSSVPVASVVSPSLTVARVAGNFTAQTCAIPSPTSIGALIFKIKATERYPAALTSLADESGFTPSYPPTNGSQVQVVFTGIPSGMAIQFNGNDTTNTSSTLTYTPNLATSVVTSSGSAITYTFSMSTTSTSTVETATFNFLIGLPGSSSSALLSTAGSLPPVASNATITASLNYAPANATTSVVSFNPASEGSVTVGTVGNCVTNLLFPYVSNQGGYDTSFSIANTTADYTAFGSLVGSAPQSGSCALSLWPTTALSTATTGTATTYTTPSIPSGGVYAFAQSTTSLSGQSGYIIAVCQFLNAHGFAFLTNGFASAGGPQLSHGYLGLVLPNPVGARVTGGNSETLGQ